MIVLVKKEKKFLFFIFLTSLITKILFFFFFLKNNPCLLLFDSEHYHKIALSLVSGNGFYNLDKITPQFYRMPGYPAFLAICYKIFGVHPIAVLITQIFVSSFILLLIFLLTLVLFPRQIRAAKLAAIVACFDLGYIIFPGLIMSEILFVIFFTIVLILFLKDYTPFFCKNRQITNDMKHESKIQTKARVIRFFIAGATLGVACLIRPVGHALALTTIFMLLISSDKFLTKIKLITGLTLGLACTLGPWILRNYLLTGYIFMHTLSGPHFLNHTAVRLCMMNEKITYKQAQDKVYAEFKNLEDKKINTLGRPLQEIESCNLAEKIALSYMLKIPYETSLHFISNMLKTTFGLYTSELLVIDSGGQLPPYSNNRDIKNILKRFLNPEVKNKFIIAIIYFEIIFFIFLLLGLAIFTFKAIFDHEKLCALIKTLSFIGCLIFLTLSCGYARLRLPIESFLIILSVMGWQTLFSKQGE